MTLSRAMKYAAIGVVAGIAAYASYSHMRHLALVHGQTPTVAALLPVSVDGMLVVATLVMREDRQDGRRARTWAWIAFVLGVGASVVANVLAAAPDITSRVISAWPAFALLLVVEVLATGKRTAVEADDTVTTDPDPLGWEDMAEPEREEPVKAKPRRPTTLREARPLSTEERVAKILARNPGATAVEIAAKLGVSERTVQRYMPKPAAALSTTDGEADPVVISATVGALDAAYADAGVPA